ncbi:hypothetical protein COU80_03930 [Candidatus Peregrinibacteria bacterium CG10_big_fil_rev_8_21_14_0_10_55_24]|nr:MAG: hypothetical protein COU80_03930 [Candidatus Peregrinibacteria bacterium CG10_big_fil_rev_8_21_14_0_10_55_24]
MSPAYVPEFLEGLYREDKVHTRSVELLDDGRCRVHFIFAPYDRTVEPMGHVGMSQMHEALVEGLYCSIGHAIQSGSVETPIDFQTFLRTRLQALFMRENVQFRKMLRPQEEATLTFAVREVQTKMRGAYYAVTCVVEGFLRGEVECWLPMTATTI